MSTESDDKSTAASDIDDKALMAHSYDGIREYDNPTPGWWKLIFLCCCVWAFGYWAYYEWGPGLSEAQSYTKTQRAFRRTYRGTMTSKVTKEEMAKAATDAETLVAGRKIFDIRCKSCHRADGGGLVGPNLTDDKQIHGFTTVDVYNLIRTGVPSKGMVAWGAQLKPEELKQVAAFVVTLRNTNVPNGKAPEGNPIPPEELVLDLEAGGTGSDERPPGESGAP